MEERSRFVEASVHVRAAVDVDLLAGDVGGFLGGQEQDGGGDLLGLAGTAHGDAVDDGLGLFGGHEKPRTAALEAE